MKLRTRLNLVVAGLTAVFVAVLLTEEIQNTRSSVREEIEAANRVASQLLGRLAVIYSRAGGTEVVLQFLQQLGPVRPHEKHHSPSASRRDSVPLAAGYVQSRPRGARMVRAFDSPADGQAYVPTA